MTSLIVRFATLGLLIGCAFSLAILPLTGSRLVILMTFTAIVALTHVASYVPKWGGK